MVLEIIGYIASAVTAFSLVMKNIRQLRWWNFAGASLFSVYGALIGAWPVFAMNAFVAVADIYYLMRMNRRKEYFDMLEVDLHNSDFAQRFLDYYKKDIAKYFPAFKPDPDKHYLSCFCLRDVRPVSLIVFSRLSEKELMVELDYAILEYRDMKTGQFIYNEGIRRLGLDRGQVFISHSGEETHIRYLRTLRFVQKGDVFVKTMDPE